MVGQLSRQSNRLKPYVSVGSIPTPTTIRCSQPKIQNPSHLTHSAFGGSECFPLKGKLPRTVYLTLTIAEQSNGRDTGFISQYSVSSSLTSASTWRVGRVWVNATALKAVEQKCSVGSNPVLSSCALVLNYGLVSPTGLLTGLPVRIGFTYGYGVM